MSRLELEIPLHLRRGNLKQDEDAYVESGVKLLALMASRFGLDGLGNSRILDIGCGTKFTQAILSRNIPIARYVGIDVYAEMIQFLRESVGDSRFSFHHIDLHNEMYNAGGQPLADTRELPISETDFDIICLFSVFTHLAPHDYAPMLKLLRNYIHPQGKLIFSLFVHELTPGGYGCMDGIMKALVAKDASLQEKQRASLEEAGRNQGPPDFIDVYPKQPLKVAMYSRKYALELMENTGWKVDSLNDPERIVEHYMICSPA